MGYKIEWLDNNFDRGVVTETRWLKPNRRAGVYKPSFTCWRFTSNDAILRENGSYELEIWLTRMRDKALQNKKTSEAWQEVASLPKARAVKC